MKRSVAISLISIILVYIVLVFVSIVFVNVGNPYMFGDKFPSITRGIMDISGIDLSKRNPARLDGEWEFYWNQLLEPSDFNNNLSSEVEYIKVPSSWNRYSNSHKYKSYGYATYRLSINVNSQEDLLGLRIPRILTAYKIWINDKLMASCGTVSTEQSTGRAQTAPNTIIFSNNKKVIQIIIQVSNFVENEAGIIESFFFGESSKMLKQKDKQIISDIFIFAFIFVMGCYHFILYIFHRKENSTLLFGVFCLIVGLRTVTSGESILLQILPMDEGILFRITYAIFGVGAIILLNFYYSLFPNEFSKKILRIFQVFNAGCVAFILCFGAKTSFNFIIVFECIGILSGIYTIYTIVLASIRKHRDALIILFGTVLLLLVIINDILNAEQIFYTNVLLIPVGLSIFIFIQSTVLALRFSDTYKRVEKLSEQLTLLDKIKDDFLSNTSLELKKLASENHYYDIVSKFEDTANIYLLEEFEKNELADRADVLISLRRSVKQAILNIQRIETEKLTSLEVLIGGIAHNLKTPLTSSAGGIRIIKRDIEKIKEIVDKKCADDRINDIINEMYNWEERIEQYLIYISNVISDLMKQVVLSDSSIEIFSVSELINAIETLMNYELKEQKCNLVKDLNIDGSMKIKGNMNSLVQVFNNLITNAIEASEENGKITIGAETQSEIIKFYVKDYGKEIPQSVKEKLFQKMVTTKGNKGVGIGLYISKSIIKGRFGGNIYFNTNEKETVFFIEIPIIKGE